MTLTIPNVTSTTPTTTTVIGNRRPSSLIGDSSSSVHHHTAHAGSATPIVSRMGIIVRRKPIRAYSGTLGARGGGGRCTKTSGEGAGTITASSSSTTLARQELMADGLLDGVGTVGSRDG